MIFYYLNQTNVKKTYLLLNYLIKLIFISNDYNLIVIIKLKLKFLFINLYK
jgi:hypothetical protein